MRVEGRVGRLRGLGLLVVGGWDIHYPLPDGSWATCRAVSMRPSALREGMSVPVLVDLDDPHRATLDYPPHDRQRTLLVLGLVCGGAIVLVGMTALALVLWIRSQV